MKKLFFSIMYSQFPPIFTVLWPVAALTQQMQALVHCREAGHSRARDTCERWQVRQKEVELVRRGRVQDASERSMSEDEERESESIISSEEVSGW